MPISPRLLLVLAAALCLSRLLSAQAPRTFSAGADYTFLRTNVLPGCNCVGLQGGSAGVQYTVTRHLAATAEVSLGHRSGITPDGYTLTQMTYLFGARYWPNPAGARVRPFATVSLGGSHAFGNLSPANNVSGGSANAFALQTGGGLEVRLNSRWTLKPIEADYLLTTFANNAANRQNDLRLSTGILFRLSRTAN